MDLSSKLTPGKVESRQFLSFCMPSNAQLEDKGELNEWLERMMFLYEDIKWLLSKQVDDFWNQVLYDETWLICLDSFLQHAPRRYDLKNVPDACKVPLNRISRLFLLSIMRMSLYNEVEDLQFSPDVFGEIIYEGFIFDAAKLLDICGIFYKYDTNVCPILEEILENIFNSQSKYYGDMSHAVNSMVDTISSIEERLLIEEKEDESGLDLKYISGRESQDILLFLFDMAKTLQSFVAVFPKSSQIFFKGIVINKLVSFSENSLLSLLDLIEVNRKKCIYICKEIEKCILNLVSVVIQHGFIKRPQSSVSDEEDLSAEFVTCMDSIAQCPNFLADYCALGNVDSDFQTIEQLGLLDNASLEYAKNMLGAVFIENDSNQVVKELKDILPEKSLTFIHKCIETYGPRVEVIMNNIMEGSIIDESDIIPIPKKPLVIPNKDVLEDNKEHVALLKSTLGQIRVSGTDDLNDNELCYDLYDDEYDDTYDSQNVGAADVDEVDELTSRRKFTIPAALRQLGDVSSESDSEEGEEEEDDEDEEEKPEQNDTTPSWNTGTHSRGARGRGRGNSRGRGGSARGGSARGGSARGGRARGGSARGGSARGGGARGGNARGGGGGSTRGDGGDQGNANQGNANQGNNAGRGRGRGNPANRGRGRGGGRSKQHRRNLGDNKRSKGMMPF